MKYLVTTASLFFYLVFPGLNLSADDHSPTEQLQPVLNQLIDILDDETLKGDASRDERRAKIMAIIASGFDFKEMSRRVLGKTWNEISEM